MQVTVYGKNLEVTGALRQYVTRKLKKIDRFFSGLGHELAAQVTMTVERGRHVVEVTMPLNGMILRGEEATENMYAAIDQVVDKLEKQVTRYKKRLETRRKSQTPPLAAVMASGDEEAADTSPEPDDELASEQVVKTKRFPMKPQSTEEAIMQLNLLGHDFYVFRNDKTLDINVVYRRRDGNYGLIEPER